MPLTFTSWWRDGFAALALIGLGLSLYAAVRCRRSRERLHLLPVTSAEFGAAEDAFRSQCLWVLDLASLCLFAANLLWTGRTQYSAALTLLPLGGVTNLTSLLILRSRLRWERYFRQWPASDPPAKEK